MMRWRRKRTVATATTTDDSGQQADQTHQALLGQLSEEQCRRIVAEQELEAHLRGHLCTALPTTINHSEDEERFSRNRVARGDGSSMP